MKQRLLTLAVYLLVGAVATLALAWASSLWAQKPVLSAARVSGAAATWPLPVAPAWPAEPNAAFGGRVFGYRISGAHTLRVRQVPGRGRRLIELERLEVHDLGWPLPALRWERREDASGTTEHHTIPMPAAIERSARSSDRRLPAQVRWTAIVDIVVFAIIAWCAVGAPLAVQRAARAWRGSCPACGYDLRASTVKGCPECGRGRTTDPTDPR